MPTRNFNTLPADQQLSEIEQAIISLGNLEPPFKGYIEFAPAISYRDLHPAYQAALRQMKMTPGSINLSMQKDLDWNILHTLARFADAQLQADICSILTPDYLAELSQVKTCLSPEKKDQPHMKPARTAYWANKSIRDLPNKREFLHTVTTYGGFLILFEYFRQKQERGLWNETFQKKFDDFCEILSFLNINQNSASLHQDIQDFLKQRPHFFSFKEGEYLSLRLALFDALQASTNLQNTIQQFFQNFQQHCQHNANDDIVQKYKREKADLIPSTNFASMAYDDQLFEIQKYIEHYLQTSPTDFLTFDALPDVYRQALSNIPSHSVALTQTSKFNWNILHAREFLHTVTTYGGFLILFEYFRQKQERGLWNETFQKKFDDFCEILSFLNINQNSASLHQDIQDFLKQRPHFFSFKEGEYLSLRLALFDTLQASTNLQNTIQQFFQNFQQHCQDNANDDIVQKYKREKIADLIPSTNFASMAYDDQLFEIQKYIEHYLQTSPADFLTFDALPDVYRQALSNMPSHSVALTQTSKFNWNILHAIARTDQAMQNEICRVLTPESIMCFSQQKTFDSFESISGDWSEIKPPRLAELGNHFDRTHTIPSKAEFITTISTHSGFLILFEYFRSKESRDLWTIETEKKFAQLCDIIAFLKAKKVSITLKDIDQLFARLFNFTSVKKESEYISLRQGLLYALITSPDPAQLIKKFLQDFDAYLSNNPSDQVVLKYKHTLTLNFTKPYPEISEDIFSILIFLHSKPVLTSQDCDEFLEKNPCFLLAGRYFDYRRRLFIALKADPDNTKQSFVRLCRQHANELKKTYENVLVELLNYFHGRSDDTIKVKEFQRIFNIIRTNHDTLHTAQDWRQALGNTLTEEIYKRLQDALIVFPADAARYMVVAFDNYYLNLKEIDKFTTNFLGEPYALLNLFQYFASIKTDEWKKLDEAKFTDFCKIVNFLKTNPDTKKIESFFTSLPKFKGYITSHYANTREKLKSVLLHQTSNSEELLAYFVNFCVSYPLCALVEKYKQTIDDNTAAAAPPLTGLTRAAGTMYSSVRSVPTAIAKELEKTASSLYKL